MGDQDRQGDDKSDSSPGSRRVRLSTGAAAQGGSIQPSTRPSTSSEYTRAAHAAFDQLIASRAARAGNRTGVGSTQVTNTRSMTQGHGSVTTITALPPRRDVRERIVRRQALPPDSLLRAPTATTSVERRDRMQALRAAIGTPVTESELSQQLNQSSWDVSRAAQSFRDRLERDGNKSSRPLDQARYILRRQNIVQARIDTVRDLRRRTRSSGASQGIRNPTTAEAYAFLASRYWDIERSEQDFQENGVPPKTRDMMNRFRSRGPSLVNQNRRLANFVTLTGAQNIVGARFLLEACSWDVARALDVWFNDDGEIDQKPVWNEEDKNRGRRITRPSIFNRYVTEDVESSCSSTDPEAEVSTRMSQLRHSEWATTTSLSPINSDDESNDVDDGADEENEKDEWIIDFNDDVVAKKDCPNSNMLVVEKIKNGRYSYYIFDKLDRRTGRRFRFNDSDHESDNEKTELDWSDAAHINQIQNWRRQIYRRGQGNKSEPRTAFTEEERDFLWQLHAEHVEEVAQADPNHFHGNGAIPLSVSRTRLQDWSNRFNARFAAMAGRPTRTATALSAVSRRIPAIVEDFGLTASNPHPDAGTTVTGRGHRTLKKPSRSITKESRSDTSSWNISNTVPSSDPAEATQAQAGTHTAQDIQTAQLLLALAGAQPSNSVQPGNGQHGSENNDDVDMEGVDDKITGDHDEDADDVEMGAINNEEYGDDGGENESNEDECYEDASEEDVET